jgi:hypothetical protein
MDNAVTDPEGVTKKYRQLIVNPKTREVWLHAAANKAGCLVQGIKNRVKGTNTIKFTRHSQVPAGRTVLYAQFCASIRPQKEETRRCGITVGSNRIDYPGEVSTKTAGLIIIKLFLKSVVSKLIGRFMTAAVKNVYLNTPLKRPHQAHPTRDH